MSRAVLFLVFAASVLAAPPDAAGTTKAIGERYQGVHEYVFEGQLSLFGQHGADPVKLLSQTKIKLASAPGGKSYLRIEPAGKDAYVLVSNGHKSWAWVPKLKQYTEEEAAARADEDADDDNASDNERDPSETFARTVMPVLARLRASAEAADFHGEAPVKFDNRKDNWPLLRVLSHPAEDGTQTLTQLAVNPETLAIGRMIHTSVQRDAAVKTTIQMNLEFSSFQTGHVDDSTFDFEAPRGAKLVDAVPIPGQTGSFLLNHPAPDFEVKTLDGEKIRLNDLRGRPVLLSFWASWCPPCRRELPALVALNRQFKDQGLVILGVNDEGKGAARKYAEQAGLTFKTADDAASNVHRLYRVHSIPTLFLIDANGKVVFFARGAREPEKIRASLAAVGF